MRLDVYDTYITLIDGSRMHFDVLLPQGNDLSRAYEAARQWIKEIGCEAEGVQLDHCRFCHSQVAEPEVEKSIGKRGYAILQMEGCPSPIF